MGPHRVLGPHGILCHHKVLSAPRVLGPHRALVLIGSWVLLEPWVLGPVFPVCQCIHVIKVTDNARGDTIEMKGKLYLRTILLINYMMEENLFVNVA